MPEDQANVLLVDDHALFRESVGRFLDSESGLRVVGGCAAIDEASEFLQTNKVDLVLLDFGPASVTAWTSCKWPRASAIEERFLELVMVGSTCSRKM